MAQQALWSGRFDEAMDDSTLEFTSSLDVDVMLSFYDVMGSLAHVRMLKKCNIIPLSIFLYWFFAHPLGMDPLIANIISWILCVAFAYVTNRTWVFENKAHDAKGILREAASFTAGRLATLGLEELILWLGITVLGLNDVVVKIIAQVLVIIGNYLISKLFVFRKQ